MRSALIFFALSAFAMPKENIPLPNPDADFTLQFCVTRDPYGFLKPSLLEQLQKAFHADRFIESGTFQGDTTFVAAKIFKEVETIELSQDLYWKACNRFQNFPNVKVIQGDSADVLPYLLKNVSHRILFYLDGHFTPGTAKGSENTPVLRELKAIQESGILDSIILIDDIRFFQSSSYPERLPALALEDYPDLGKVVEAVLAINASYQICFLGDALLAYPQTKEVSPSFLVSGCAMHRLADICPSLLESELEMADFWIAEANPEDRKAMEDYYETYSSGEMDLGLRSYGALWFALMLQQLGLQQQADALILQAATNSLPGWRIERFIPCP
ncbi:MAG: hypothetical protein K1X28_00275 [Parachlamydiales bacterium]|nr:hypothetical protein [Parachlamydiales bacterium]